MFNSFTGPMVVENDDDRFVEIGSKQANT